MKTDQRIFNVSPSYCWSNVIAKFTGWPICTSWPYKAYTTNGVLNMTAISCHYTVLYKHVSV